VDRPFVTGRINYTPEAQQQLNQLDDWITQATSAEIARRFVSAILDHIDGILIFPLAGRPRDDVRAGMRTTTFRKRTLVAYEVDESSGELVVNILGVFHGGLDWESALGEDQGDREAGR
jgi:toxin ParE1/3/4